MQKQNARLTPIEEARSAIEKALRYCSYSEFRTIDPPLKFSDWSLDKNTTSFLIRLVLAFKPHHVMEFGSGLSTRAFAWAGAELDESCRITSIDHDPVFGRGTIDQLEFQQCKAQVQLQISPLVLRDCAGMLAPMYFIDKSKIDVGDPVDLVLIDGPPKDLGGRLGTLFQIMDFARSGTLVLLDDANRPDECHAIKVWRSVFGTAIEMIPLPGFPKGLMAIIIIDPVSMSQAYKHRLGIIADKLEELIPKDVKVVLLDQNEWRGAFSLSVKYMLSFPTKEGVYSGPPSDSETAVCELRKMVESGAEYIILGWPAFWWLEYYQGLREFLRTSCDCIAHDINLRVFKVCR